MVTPSERKEAAEWAVQTKNISIRRACRLFSIGCQAYRYESKRQPDDEVREALLELAEKHKRWGFGLMFDYLRYNGHKWNHKRVYRVYKELELNLRIKPRKRIESRNPVPLSTPDSACVSYSVDFTSDSLNNGQRFRTFNVIDDYNRESLAITVGYSLPSSCVTETLDQVAIDYGYPAQIRCDNGPEFISHEFKKWCSDKGIHIAYIEPGCPTQNAFIERFNRTYREEVLDLYAFSSISEVQEITSRWRYDYNHHRPHSSLNRMPPVGYAQIH